MGKNNPMNVKYFTYKVEFQERGAGHIHGTLWLDLVKLENLTISKEGALHTLRNGQDSCVNEEHQHMKPLKGLRSAFRKIKDNLKHFS